MTCVLQRSGLPVAYHGLADDRTYTAELCDMFPFEVVVYGIVDASSSFRKRNPHHPSETLLSEPVVHFHLKTTDKIYRGRELPCDDPVIMIEDGDVRLYAPNEPIEQQEPFVFVSMDDAFRLFPGIDRFGEMETITRNAYVASRFAFAQVGGRLYDGKFEFGIPRRPTLGNRILIADVFDADSMRLTVYGHRADKQPIRDGGEAAILKQVKAYELAVLTSERLMSQASYT
jgi:phosphoribosylaminoimidazole-succinocarboxamide synthase